MRILHLISSEKWTGAAEPVLSLARWQQQLGHQTWLALIPGRSFEQEARPTEVKLVTHLYLNRRLNPFHFLSDLRNMKTLIQQHEIDIVHTHLPHDHWLAVLATRTFRKQSKLRLLRSVHRLRIPPAIIPTRRLFYSPTDAILVPSEGFRQLFLQRLRIPQEKIFTVPGAVDLDRFSPSVSDTKIRQQGGIAADTPVAGIVARLRKDRGIGWLLKSIPLVLKRLPQAHFLIVGRGELKYPLRKLLTTLPYGDQIIMAGYRTHDLPEYYAAFNVSLFLGLGSEGTCRAILEAMACARPVIGLDVLPVNEIIKPGYNGLLATPGDPHSLAHALIELLSDPEKARSMGKNARQLVQEKFTERARAVKVLEIYQKIQERTHAHG